MTPTVAGITSHICHAWHSEKRPSLEPTFEYGKSIDIHWISTYGGRFIVLEESLLNKWHGFPNDGRDPLDTFHDYGRACALNGLAATRLPRWSIAMAKKDLIYFFMDSDDYSQFLAFLKSLSLCFDESGGFLTLGNSESTRVDPYGALNFFESRLNRDVLVMGRIGLPKRRVERLAEFMALREPFAKIRTWIVGRFTNELVEVNLRDSRDRTATDDIWLGPGARQKVELGKIRLKHSTNSDSEYLLRETKE